MDRPHIQGAHHIGLSVSNVDRSGSFYCDVLGATLVRPPYAGDSPSFMGRMAIVSLGTTGVDVFEHSAHAGDRFDPTRTGLDHIGFTCDSIDELRRWAAWLDAQAVARSDIRSIVAGDTEIGSMFDFSDPDGVQLEFLYLDRSSISQSALFRG